MCGEQRTPVIFSLPQSFLKSRRKLRTELCSALRAKGYIGVTIDSDPFLIPAEKDFSHLYADGDKPELPAFSFNPNDKVVQIDIFFAKTESFADTKPTIQDQTDEAMEPALGIGSGFEAQKDGNIS